MGSITEKQKEFVAPNWNYPRSGVTHTKTLEMYERLELERDNGPHRTIGIRRTLGVLKTKGRKLWNSWFHRRS